MSRTLSAPTSAAAAQAISLPGLLVQLGFTFPLRYSTRVDETWNGQSWQQNNVKIGQLQEKQDGSASLTIIVGNTDRAFGAVCLNEPPQEKAVTVWAFYEGALAAGDPVQIFTGAIESCDITEADVTLQCTSLNQRTLIIPRRRISAATGFNHLLPAGRVIEFDGVRYEISRDA